MGRTYRPVVSSKEQKILWLLNNRDKWERWPQEIIGVTCGMQKDLFDSMCQAGLYSKKTASISYCGLFNLIAQTRNRLEE